MENAIQALKMAAAVMIFVLSLTITITSFGEARKTLQTIISSQDREFNSREEDYVSNATDASGNIITQRTIRAETIVPTIYKAYKENYKIVFKGLSKPLYEKASTNSSGDRVKIYAIDLEKDVIGINKEKEEFIMALLYGSKYPQLIDKFKKTGIFLYNEDFYDTIKGKSFIESLGVYYQDELQGASDVPDANRIKKRVITYTLK